MPVTLANDRVIPAVNALDNLSNNYKLRRNISLDVARIMERLQPEAKFIQEQRQEIFEECVERDSNGDPKPVLDSEGNQVDDKVHIDKDAFNEQIEELMDGETTLHVPTLSIEDFPEQVEGSIIYGLSAFIEDFWDSGKEEDEDEEN